MRCSLVLCQDVEHNLHTVSTSNHMLGRAIWDKLVECIFENLENFQKSLGRSTQKITRTKHVVTG